MSDVAIRVENLSKQYKIGRAQARLDTLRDALSGVFRRGRGNSDEETFWALRDVSLLKIQSCNFVRVLGALLCLLLALFAPLSVHAQSGVVWTDPVNLSDTPTSSVHPAVVADSYGNIHVFWTDDLNGREIAANQLPNPANSIVYRRYDGVSWTDPVDIIAIASDPLADFVSVAVDSTNRLHLVWTGLTRIYYSNAYATEAADVKAWLQPQAITPDSARTTYEADVVVDASDKVHIIYATRGESAGVFHAVVPQENGENWTPIRISGGLRSFEVGFANARMTIDIMNRLHAVWSTANDNGFSQAVYYTRKEPDYSWEIATMLADATINNGFTGFPSLLAYEDDRLLLHHVDETNQDRIERDSSDGGQSWSDPRRVITTMEGVNGFNIPLIDSGGTLHLIVNMRPSSDQRTGIYYAPRSGLDWVPVTPVAIDEPFGPTAHYMDAAIRLGNEIHIVWTQLRGAEVWHVQGSINGLAPLMAQALPTQANGVSNTTLPPVVDMVSSTPDLLSVQSGPGELLPPELANEPARSTSSTRVVGVAVISAAILVFGVLLLRVRHII